MVTTKLDIENEKLAKKYRPLLVLYPEIEDGSRRKDHYHPARERLGWPPLDQDYHPRDIRLILDHVWLRDRKGKPSREDVIDVMSINEVQYIDLIDGKGPKHVNKFWKVYAGIRNKDSILDEENKPLYGRKVYARVLRGTRWFENYISIQYWMAFFFDDWANVHEMDWEMVSVILKKTDKIEKPVACVYNAHVGSFRKWWDEVQKVDDDKNRNPEGLHPVAYIANGSHAAYFSDFPRYFCVAESYLKSALNTVLRITNVGKRFTDYVPSFEEGFKCFPDVELIPELDKNASDPEKRLWSEKWGWLNFNGKWGSPVELSFWERIIARCNVILRLYLIFQEPAREAGPPGPNTRRVCWEEPFEWVNLECFDAPETKPWIGEISKETI